MNRKLLLGVSVLLMAVAAWLHPATALALPLIGMAQFDTVAADAMLKVTFEDPLWDSVVGFSKLIDLFEENSNVIEGPTGRYVETVNMIGYNEGIGARPADSGFLPVAGNPTFVNGRIKLKKTLAVARMTYFVMKQAMKSKAAFANWAEVELTKTEKGLRYDLNRQAIGFGMGALGQIDGTPSGTTVNVKNPYTIAPTGNNVGKVWRVGLRRGMRLVAGPNADGSGLRSNGLSALVTSVSKTGNSGKGALTVDAIPADWASSDYLWRGDDVDNAAPHGGTAVEIMGILGMIDNGSILDTLQNISRTTYPEWKSQYIDASLAPYSALPTEPLFQRMADDALELGNGEITHFVTTTAVYRSLQNQIRKQLGYGARETSPSTPVGGTREIKILLGDREVVVRALPNVPEGSIFGLDKSTLQRHHLQGFEWDDTTGAIFRQVADGGAIQDAFYAYGRTLLELSCRDPQRSIRADNVDESLA